MATRVNDNLITDKSKNELTSTEYIKHGSTWLADTINTAVSTLSGKADKTYVDTELAKKANTSAVTALETKVNSKADASTVSQLQTAVNSKADSSTVSALSSQVSSNTTGIAEANSRIDQIIALPEGSTTGDAELQDIRTKADGTKAASAGAAVREQVADLKSDLDAITVSTRNLVNFESVTESGLTVINNNDGTYSLSGTVSPYYFLREYYSEPLSGMFTVSVTVESGTYTDAIELRTRNADNLYAIQLSMTQAGVYTKTFQTSDLSMIEIYFPRNTVINTTFSVQLEKGYKATQLTAPISANDIESRENISAIKSKLESNKNTDVYIYGLNEANKNNGIINSAGSSWSYTANPTYEFITVKVNAGDVVSITSKNDEQLFYAVFTDEVDTSVNPTLSADYAFNTRQTLAQGTSVTRKMPGDAKYLVLFTNVNNVNAEPVSLIINGNDIINPHPIENKIKETTYYNFNGTSDDLMTAGWNITNKNLVPTTQNFRHVVRPKQLIYDDADRIYLRFYLSNYTSKIYLVRDSGNSDAASTPCFVDFANKKVGICNYTATFSSLDSEPTVSEQMNLQMTPIQGHSYIVTCDKRNGNTFSMSVTDEYTMQTENFAFRVSHFVSSGWGYRGFSLASGGITVREFAVSPLQKFDADILIAGDSFIEGNSIYYQKEDRWSAKIRDHINTNVSICGKGGATSTLLTQWINQSWFRKYTPKVLIVGIGTNDLRNQQSVETFKSNIRIIKNYCDSIGCQMLLQTVCPTSETTSYAEKQRELNTFIRTCGYDYVELAYCMSLNNDEITVNPTLFGSDYVHPSVEGHEVIYKRMVQSLEKYGYDFDNV